VSSPRADGLSVAHLRLDTEIDFSALRTLLVRWSGAPRIAEWFRVHGDLAALTVAAVAFVFQIVATRDRSLSPDEALQVAMVNLPGLAGVYRNSQWNAHPPLFFLILHFWLRLGRSEFFLRLLPAIFGAAFLWFSRRWAGRLFGRTAGVMTLLLIAFAPVLLPLSAEVRGYSLLLLLSVSALAEFENAVEARSPARMVVFSLLLYLAILTHYGALFITLSLFVYALARFWRSRLSGRVLGIWAGFQVGAAALYLFLYVTQVSRLRGGPLEHQAMTVWLDTSYFRSDQETPVFFVVRQTAAVFHYFFGSPIAAAVGFSLAAAGVVHLALKRQTSVLLVVLPFLFGAAAGLLGLYPFGGTRHSVYLLPYAAAAIAVAVSAFSGWRPWLVLLLFGALVTLFRGAPVWSAPRQSLSAMNVAVDQIQRTVPAGSLLFTDYRTGAVLSYYLARNSLNTERPGLDHFWERDAGSYCLVRSPIWAPDLKSFGDEVERLTRAYRLPPGQRFWVIRNGWEFDLVPLLSRRFPGSVFPVLPRFGDMSIAEVWP